MIACGSHADQILLGPETHSFPRQRGTCQTLPCHFFSFEPNFPWAQGNKTQWQRNRSSRTSNTTPPHHSVHYFAPPEKMKTVKFLRKCPFCGVSFQWVHRPVSAGAFGATVTCLEWQWILIFITVISTFFGWNNFKMNILPGKELN